MQDKRWGLRKGSHNLVSRNLASGSIVSQQLSCDGNFMMKTFKWYGPFSFGVNTPKMRVYISERVEDRSYDVIKMAAKTPQHLLFWSTSEPE